MAYRERQKISQMTPKGSNLAATDLIEISELVSGTYQTKSITGQEIIDGVTPDLSGYVPYVGATQDVDLDANKLSAESIYIEGTNGNGHLHLKHQNADATATGQSTALWANTDGDIKWKNDNDYKTTLKTSLNTADRVYTFPDADCTLVPNGAITGSGLTMATSRLLGRTTALSGAVEEISIGTGLTLSGGTLSSTGVVLTIGTTAITSGTVGRILFEGTGNVVQEDSALFWDNTNKRLGVGATPSTSVRLDVRAQGALSTDIAFRVRNSADTANLVRFNGNGGFKIGLDNAYHISLDPTSPSLRGQNGAIVAWQLSPWTGEHGWLTNNSTNQNLIGIGTTSPTDKLHIYNTVNDYRIRIAVGASNPADESCGIRFTTTWAGTSFGVDAANLVVRTKGTNNLTTQRTALEFRMNALGTSALRASLTSQSNFLLQSPTEDTNDIGVIYVPNGTAPTGSITDGYKQYSADIVAGNAAPHFRTENGAIVKVYQETTAVAAATFVANTSLIANDTATFDGYTIGQVVKALRNLGILA